MFTKHWLVKNKLTQKSEIIINSENVKLWKISSVEKWNVAIWTQKLKTKNVKKNVKIKNQEDAKFKFKKHKN